MERYNTDPTTYLATMRAVVPAYERIHDALVKATLGIRARRILDLGTGTGETARRLLEAHPRASLVGLDASPDMLASAETMLAGQRVELRAGRLEDQLPLGPFDLVTSAFTVHHLDGPAKAHLFWQIHQALGAGGRFVLADVVVPEDPDAATTPLDPGEDLPDTIADQIAWLTRAGFAANPTWTEGDFGVLAAQRE